MATTLTPTTSSPATIRPGSQHWRELIAEMWGYLRRDMSWAVWLDGVRYPDAEGGRMQRVVPMVRRVSQELGSPAYLPTPVVTYRRRDTGEVLTEGPIYDQLIEDRRKAGVDRALRAASEQCEVLGCATIWVEPTRHGHPRVVVPPPHRQWVRRLDTSSIDERDVLVWWREVPRRGDDSPVAPIDASTPWWLRVTPSGATWHRSWSEDGKDPVATAWDGTSAIPATVIRSGPVDDGEWWPMVPHDLLLAQRAINHDLTDEGDVSHQQGWGQGWLRGVSASDALKIGLRSWIELAPDGDMGFASPNADLAGMRSVSEAYQSSVVAHQGLNPAVYQRSAGMTALAKAIELADRAVEQQRQEEELRRAEQRVYDQMRMWYQSWGLERPDVDVIVDYQARPLPQEPQAAAQTRSTYIASKVVGVVRARAERDGVDMVEARRRVLADLAADREVFGDPDRDEDRRPPDGPGADPDGAAEGDRGVAGVDDRGEDAEG